MRNRHDRLTKYGVVALAGIAVLGWIREPEKHPSFKDPASASSAQSRTTFFPPPDTAGVEAVELPGDPPSVRANNDKIDSLIAGVPERVNPKSVEADQESSAVIKTRERAPVNGGRHEGPQQSAEQPAATRSQESREERPLEPEVPEHAVRKSERRQDKDTGAINTGGQNQPVVAKKDRSTAKSAAIIVGAAATGAAIGAATGGGKGAAIGAVSGGAGGYVYDRMTRRKGVRNVPTVTDSDKDQPMDGPGYDRAPSLARRFGTPTFN